MQGQGELFRPKIFFAFQIDWSLLIHSNDTEVSGYMLWRGKAPVQILVFKEIFKRIKISPECLPNF